MGGAVRVVALGVLLAGCGDDSAPPAGDAGCERWPVPVAGGCLRDPDCAEGVCRRDPAADDTDLEPVALSCGEPGGPGAPGERCASAGDCARALCVVAGTCVVPCGDHGDCGGGERCREVYARAGDAALQPVFACVPHASVPPEVEVVRAAVEGGVGAGASTDVSIPAFDARGLAVLELGCGAVLETELLATADDPPVVLFDPATPGVGSEPPSNPVARRRLPLTALVPNGPRSPETGAGYVMTVASDRSAPAELSTLQRSGPGTTLDLDLFYVGGRGWEPEGERGPEDLARSLDAVETILGAAGIGLGEVRQHAVVGELRDRYAIVDVDLETGRYLELDGLLRLSAGAAGPSIPIFLVRSIDRVMGIAGGVPGPMGIHGTTGSGIALGVDLLPSISALDRAIAHEVGHFLGLFHPIEPDGTVVEPLPDTPVCSVDRDDNGDGLLDADECDGAGADNLMFWTAGGLALTEDQVEVLVHGFVLRR